MPEVIATMDPAADPTVEATAQLTGGRCVGPPTGRNAGGFAGISDTGDGLMRCGLPSAQGVILGVASHDCPTGGRVTVLRAPKSVPVECSAAITIGTEVQTGADGRVAPVAFGAAARAIGLAISATTAAGQYCNVMLYAGAAGPQGT